MSKDPRVYLAHISECLGKIEQFTAGGKGRFLQDALVQDAVLRNFEGRRSGDDQRPHHHRTVGA